MPDKNKMRETIEEYELYLRDLYCMLEMPDLLQAYVLQYFKSPLVLMC